MSNDDFDDVYYEEYELSEDDAVRAIATFGWSLYSSDVLIAYRLRGQHRVSDEARRMAGRCVLFLRSELEYKWPPRPTESGRFLLQAACFNLGLPGSFAMLLICTPLLAGKDHSFALQLVVPSVIVLAISLWVLFWGPRNESESVQAWKRSGDWEAWPFYQLDNLAAAAAYKTN